MGKIVLSQNVSVDGVMQSPGPTDVPFKYRGWAVDLDAGGAVGGGFALESAKRAEALLLGRVTYEAMHAFWPTAEGELADRLNMLPKYVVSSTATALPWNTTVLGEGWREDVAKLRAEVDGEALVYGSRRLCHALMGMGLVDEVRLLVYPVALGTGDRLFEEMQDKVDLRLVDARPSPEGPVAMTYAPTTAGG